MIDDRRFYSNIVYEHFAIINAYLNEGGNFDEARELARMVIEADNIRYQEGLSMEVFSGTEKIGTVDGN